MTAPCDTLKKARSSALEGPAESPIATIRRRPGFAAAVRNSTIAPLALLDQDPRFYRCIGDIPTYAMAVLALYLNLKDGIHHRGLQEITGKGGLFSAGRATAILWRLQSAGMIAPTDAFSSGKRRRYAPAPAMQQAIRDCYRIELESLSLMDARAGAALDRYSDPLIFDTMIAALAERLLEATQLDDEMLEPLAQVGRRSMGLMIAYSLAAGAFKAGREQAEGVIEVNFSDLARRLGVSRAHGRRVLALLEPAGLQRDEANPNRFTLTPAFTDAYETYFGAMFMQVIQALDRLESAHLLAVADQNGAAG